MDEADEKFEPPTECSAANYWPLGPDESDSLYFLDHVEAESNNILTDFSWNVMVNTHRCFDDHIQINENDTAQQFHCSPSGEKSAVKSTPQIPSYYRCTNSKCSVKKRVERWWEEPESVITTYEGQHCHHASGFLGAYHNYSHVAVGIDHPPAQMLQTPLHSHSNELQLVMDQGLLPDIVSPTMHNQ